MPVLWCIVVAVACAGVVGGATWLQRSTAQSPFVSHALGDRTPAAPLQRPMLADALQRVTDRGVEVSTHGQSIAVALDGARGSWTRHANGVERRLPYGRESIVLTKLSAEELVTVDHRLGARTWRWRLATSLHPRLRDDGSVVLGGKARSRLAILPVAILDAGGRNVTPSGLRWSLAHAHGSTWLQLRLEDASLPLPYVIDPNIALTGTCPDSAGQTDLVGAGSAVAQSCSVAAVAGRNPTTNLVLTAPATLANNDVMIAQVTIHSGTAPTPPTGWTLINSQVSGTAVLQSLYYRVASGDTGGTTQWTWSDSAKADMAGGIIALANVDTASPVDAVASATAASGLTATAPTVTTIAPNDEVLAFYASANGVTLSTSTYSGAATTELYSAESRLGGGTSDTDASAAIAPALQATQGATGTSTASLSASQPWVAHTLALKTTGPTSITFNGSRTKAASTATWTVGLTASAGGALSAGNTITVTFPATWTGIPASPTVTFGGSFAGCGSTTASTAGSVVTITLPAGCTLANSAAGTVAIAGITNPPAATYTAATFAVHTSADQADTVPAAGVVIGSATPPTAVTFAGSRTKAGARATWTAGFTASSSGALAAGDTVTVTFDPLWAAGLPASPAVTFGGSFGAGCSGGATGSTSSNVVTVTLPAGCTLANSAAGTVAIAGITNPTNATYTATNFKVHTSSDATDASNGSTMTISVATSLAAASFTATTKIYGTSESWTVGLTASGTGSLAAGDSATITFDAGFASGLPASPAVTFGGGFAGCSATTGSTASNVVTVTLPAGCTLANNVAGTIVIAGITDPVPATYTTANFKVHTSSDATNTNNATAVTIAKKNLTISGATATNKVYDATTTATVDFTSATLSGIVGSDSVSINSSAYSASFATKTVGNAKAVTVLGVTLSGTNAGNYTVSQPTGLTANITAKALAITGVTASNKVYDGTLAATLGGSAALSGVIAGDTVTLGGVGSGTFASKTVGNAKPVTVTGFTISGTDAANYTLTQPSPTANITAKALTITGVTATNRVYDASVAATLGGSAALSGVIAGDTVTLGGSGSGTFADKNVGNAKPVTVTGFTISGTDAGNYTVSQPSGLTANITAKALTITGVTATDKIYDGTLTATLGGSAALSGVVAGDTVTLGGSPGGTFATKTVGNGKAVTVTGYTISGTDAANYNVSQPSGLTANITAKALTVNNVTGQNKPYDGTTVDPLNVGTASLAGIVAGDTVLIDTSAATGAFATKTAGTSKPVTVSGITITGADAGNYTVTQPSTTADVTAKNLTISNASGNNRVYDATTVATVNFGSATLVGVVGADSVSIDASAGTYSFATKNAGNGKAITVSGIALTGTDAGNYTVSQPTGLTANVTQAGLSVAGVTAQNKTYDATTGATLGGTATLAGVIGGDTVSLGGTTTASFADKNVGTNKAVGVSGYTISGPDSGNYTLSQPTGLTANISAAPLTVSGVTAQAKVYDATTGATLTGTAALSGKLGSDVVTLGGSPSASFADKNVGTGKTVTVTGYTISGADAGNYTFSQPTGLTASITAAPLTVTGVVAQDKTYDAGTGATLGGAPLPSGVQGGDTVTIGGTATATFADKNVGANKTVNVSGYTLSGADAADYTLTQPTLTASITAAPLTVTGITASDKVYDASSAATLAGTATLSGKLGSDDVTLAGSPSATFANKNVGVGKVVTVSGYSIVGTDAGNYAFAQPGGLTASITPTPLTVSGLAGVDKVYDTTTSATLTGTPALSGKLGSDAVTLGGTGSAAYADKNVGADKPLVVTGFSVSGADAGNYTFSQPTGITAGITPAPLTIGGVSASNKVYNGTTSATLTGTAALSGKLSSDVVTLGGSPSASFADKNVGTGKTVTVTGYTISGADAGNYSLSQPSGLTADVTAAPLSVAGAVAQGKPYDGTTTATVDFSGASPAGVVSGDTVTLVTTGYSASFATAAAGSGIAVTVAGVTLGGAGAGNYTLTQPVLSADITGAPLTITGVTAQDKVYDRTTAATLNVAGAALSGVVAGDDVTLVKTGATGSFATNSVGTGKAVTVTGFTITGADAAKYQLFQPTGLTANIAAKAVTVNGVTASSRQYDGGVSANLDTGSATLVGVVAGDAVSLNASGATGSFATKTVGVGKTVTVSGLALTGADAGNYSLTQPTPTASVTAKPLTVSGVTAQNKTYDGATTATVDVGAASLNGVIAGDTVLIDTSAATGTFASKDTGSGIPVTVSGITAAGADAANYTITPPTTGDDITPAGLTISGAVGQDKTYDAGTTAVVDFSHATLVGVVGADSVSIQSSSASTDFDSKDVGTAKPITVTGLTLTGTDAADYTLAQPTGITADITAATLTVNGISATDKTYDRSTTATLTGTATLGGVLGSDTVTLTGSPTAGFADKTAATNKPVTISGYTITGTDAADYILTQPTSTATITPKTLTITGITAQDKTYDGTTNATLTGTPTLNGVISSDTVTLGGTPAASFADKNVGNGKGVTVTGYTISGADAGNYTLTQPTLTATITTAPLTVTGLTAQNKTYDATTTATLSGSPSLTGVIGADDVTLAGTPSASFATATAGPAKAVAITGFSITGADAVDYTLTQPSASADIARAALAVTGVTASDKTYDGDTTAALDITNAALTGVIARDTVTLDSTNATGSFASKTVGAAKLVTAAGFALGGADAANYTLAQPTATASITPKTLTISGVAAINRTYDGTTGAPLSAGGASLVGTVAGDVVALNGTPTGSFATKHVGTNKPVTVSGFGITGTDAVNYALAQPVGLTADVTARAITVTAQPDTKAYDTTTSSSATPQVTSGSLAAGDTANFTQAFATAGVSTNKTIVPSGAVLDGNSGNDYAVTFVDGTGTITSAAPEKLAFTAEPLTATGGTAFSTQPEISVEDHYGNVITNDNTTKVTLAIGTNPSSATLKCPTSSLTVQVSNGVAAFAGCKIDESGTGYTLHATNDAGLAAADSDPFDVVLGGVSATNSTISAPAVDVADGTTAGTVTVTLADSGDNPVAGKTVTLAQDAGKHSVIAPASAVTDANGQATFSVRDQTQEAVTFTATDVDDTVTVAATASVSFEDHNPPTVTIGTPANAVDAAGTITLTATGVSDGETGVQGVSFRYCDGTCATVAGTDSGGGTWTAALDTSALGTGHTYTWSATATDKANNSATSATHTFSVDNTIPVVSFGAPSLTGNAYYDATAANPTIWLPTSGSGTITLNASASDPESGVAKVHFPALLGTAATDATGPYQAGPYPYNNQASDLLGNSIVATNGVTAGNGADTAAAAFDIKVDGTGPTAAMAATLDGKTVSSGVLVGATSSDAGSGVAQVSFLYCDRTANAVCMPSLPIGTATSPTLGTYTVAWTNTGLTDGHAYAVAAVATDNVGNQTTSSISTVTVDNSAPTVSLQTPTTTGNAFFGGGKIYVNPAGGGSYTLHAHAADTESGIASVVFGATAGTTSGGGDYDSSQVSLPVADSTATVTATNGVELPAPLQSNDTLQVVNDGTVPTLSSDFPVDNGGYDSNTWPAGCATEGLCGTVGDTGSGVQKVELTLEDLGGGKYFNGTSFQVGSSTLPAVHSGSTWSYALAHAKLTTGTYELTITAFDNVGNTTTQTLQFQYGDDLTPPDTILTLSNATHAFLENVGSHLAPNAGYDYDLFYSTAGNGGFALHAVSTDVSGIDHVVFPAVFGTSQQTVANGGNANPWTLDSPSYSFGTANTTPPGQAVVTSVDTSIPGHNSGDDTITFLVDNSPPTGGAISVGPVDGNDYATTTSLTVSHTAYADSVVGSGLASSVLTVASSPLTNGSCGSFTGSAPVSDGPFTGTNGTCYQFTLTGTDNVGNVATTTQVVKIDATAPSTPTVAFGGLSPANTYDDNAGTLWYRPSTGGTFTVTASSTDAESGIGTYTFSSLLGGTQTGGRLAVTFGAGGIGSGTYTVKSTNHANLDSSPASFTVDADSTAPTSGALSVNGTPAAAAATSSYLTSGSTVTIDSRTDYTDAHSGIATSTLTVETATLAHNACGSYGAPSAVTGTTAQPVSNGHCYRFVLTGTDRVGNVASVSTVVMVDTTAPSTPSVVFSGLSGGNTYDDGNGTLWYRPSAGGTFTVTATGSTDLETDIESGNAGYTFSPLAGFTSTAQTGNTFAVTFDSSSTGGGSYSAVSTNNAGVDSSPAAFSVTSDTTDPTGGLLSIAPYSSSLTVAIGEADFTDAQSGIAGNVLTRSNPLSPSAGSCPGTGYSGGPAVPVSGGTATDTVPADGKCYEYTLTGTDHVGNVATYTTIVLVDTTPPTGGTVDAPDGLTSLTKVSVGWNAGSDPESGISTVDVQRADATLSGATCGAFGSFNTIVTNASASPIVDGAVSAGNCYEYRIVVTNRAGVTATFAASSVTKLTSASPIALAGSSAGTYLSGTTLYLGPSATTFGLQLTNVGANGVTRATWSSTAGSLTGAGGVSNASPFTSATYTWDQVAPLNTSITVTRQPTNTVDTLDVESDTTEPTGTINQPNGVVSARSVPVSTSGVADGQSGVASVQIMRADAALVGSTCGTWSAFQPVTLTGGNDTSIQDEHCYQYQVVVTDNVGNVHTDTSTGVVQVPDITPPTFVSAATDAAGTHVAITMSEQLDAGSVPSAGRFTVAYNGVSQPTPTSAQILGSTVTLGLAGPPNNSQTVTVRYASDGSLRDVATPSSNSTTNFGPVPVTNNTPDTVAPRVSSAAVDGSTLTIHLDEALAGSAPDPSAFMVTVHGHARQVTSVDVGGQVVTLALNPGVAANDTVVAAYAVPALNALHDAAGNPVSAFTTSVTNNTAAVSAPPSTVPATPAAPVPALVSTTPADGSTVASVSSFSLTADSTATWSQMSLTRPDGTVTPLDTVTGTTATYAPGTTAQGLYVVRGTMTVNGVSADVLSHFTIFNGSAGGSATMPPVQKNAGDVPDTLASSDAAVVAAWTPQTFGGEPVVVQLVPRPAAVRGSLPAGAVVVDATAFLRDSHAPVTQLADVLDLQFPHTVAGSSIQTSQDGRTWTDIAQLPTMQLPAGQPAGWFLDSDGTTHVLTRHLTYFAVIPPSAATKLALRVTTPRRLWLAGRSFMAVRIVVTAPARVTGSFVAPDGKIIPGQVLRTPTRHAGATILRIPLHVRAPGLYRLEVHAEGAGQVAQRTARIRFVRQRPTSPVWQAAGPVRVAVVQGLRLQASTLRAALGHDYVVQPVRDADLYSEVDPSDPRAAAAVIVDLASVPLPSLASLHALLPELRIIGLTRDSSTAAAARAAGIDAIVVRASAPVVTTHVIKQLIPRR